MQTSPDTIVDGLFKFIWIVFIQGPLVLIDVFSQILKFLTGEIFYRLLFGSNEFNINKLPPSFYSFIIVAIFIGVIIFIVHFLSLVINDEQNFSQRFVQSLKSSLKALLLIIIIPVGFFLGIMLIDFGQKTLNLMFGSDQLPFAKWLYMIGDPNWSGVIIGKIPDGYTLPENYASYNWIVEIGSVWLMFSLILVVGLGITAKVFELYLMFIIGPFYAATMVSDDGIKFKYWQKNSLSKILVVISTILVFDVFNVVYTSLNSMMTGALTNAYTRMGISLLILAGGLVFVYFTPRWIARMLNEGYGISEWRNFFSSTIGKTSKTTIQKVNVNDSNSTSFNKLKRFFNHSLDKNSNNEIINNQESINPHYSSNHNSFSQAITRTTTSNLYGSTTNAQHPNSTNINQTSASNWKDKFNNRQVIKTERVINNVQPKPIKETKPKKVKFEKKNHFEKATKKVTKQKIK